MQPAPSTACWRPFPARSWLGLLASAALLAGCVVAPRGTGHPGYGGANRPQRPAVAPPSPPAAAAAVYFYPERNQPEPQQERDRYTCYRWAVGETGTDLGMTPVRRVRQAPAEPLPQRRDGSGPLVGAVAGAAVGAAVSSPRHAAENAVIGAVFGAVLGAAAQAQAQDRDQQRAADADRQGRWQPMADPVANNFRRAMSTCMQARGYRVG